MDCFTFESELGMTTLSDAEIFELAKQWGQELASHGGFQNRRASAEHGYAAGFKAAQTHNANASALPLKEIRECLEKSIESTEWHRNADGCGICTELYFQQKKTLALLDAWQKVEGK